MKNEELKEGFFYNIMKFFFKIKHWQLFGIFFAASICTAITEMSEKKDYIILIPDFIISFLLIFPFACWLYSLGINLHKKLPMSVKMNLKRFKISFFVSIFYMLCFGAFIFIGIDFMHKIFGLIFIIHIFALYYLFYCFYFVAKSLKSIELQKEAIWSENDYALYFFSLCFFPIGIWVLQPKINKLFDN